MPSGFREAVRTLNHQLNCKGEVISDYGDRTCDSHSTNKRATAMASSSSAEYLSDFTTTPTHQESPSLYLDAKRKQQRRWEELVETMKHSHSAELKRERASHLAEIDELRQYLREREVRVTELTDQLDNYQKDLDKTSLRSETQAIELAQAKELLKQQAGRVSHAKLTEVKEGELKRKIASLEDQRTSLLQTVSRLESENLKLRALDRNPHEDEAQRLAIDTSLLEGFKRQVDSLAERSNLEIRRYEEEMERSAELHRIERVKGKQVNRKLQEALEAAEARCQDLEAQLNEQASQAKRLTLELGAKTRRLHQLETEIQTLACDLENERRENLRLGTDLRKGEVLEREITALVTRLGAAEAQIVNHARRNEDLESENERLRIQCRAAVITSPVSQLGSFPHPPLSPSLGASAVGGGSLAQLDQEGHLNAALDAALGFSE